MKTEMFVSDDGFEISQFDSGEWNVKLIDIMTPKETIHWNWFNEPDAMIPLMKKSALCTTFPFSPPHILDAPYLPYSRQDRAFDIGMSIYSNTLLSLMKFTEVHTLCLHGHSYPFHARLISSTPLINSDNIIVYPDMSANRR